MEEDIDIKFNMQGGKGGGGRSKVEPVMAFLMQTPPSVGKRTDSERRTSSGVKMGTTHSPGFYWTFPGTEEEETEGGGVRGRGGWSRQGRGGDGGGGGGVGNGTEGVLLVVVEMKEEEEAKEVG